MGMTDDEYREFRKSLKKSADTMGEAQVALARAIDAEAYCRAALAEAEEHTKKCRIAAYAATKAFDSALFRDGDLPMSNDAPISVLSQPLPPPPPLSFNPDATLPERIRGALATQPDRPMKVKEIIVKLGAADDIGAKAVRAAITRMKTQHNGGIVAVGHGKYRLK